MQLEATERASELNFSADELGQYKSLSLWAVFALILGLLSLLVFVSPMLMIFPLATLGAASLALLKISNSEENLTGKNLARVGLALAVVATTAAYAKTRTAQYLYDGQIESVVRPWLEAAAASDFKQLRKPLTLATLAKLESEGEKEELIPAFAKDNLEIALEEDEVFKAIQKLTTPERFPEVVEYDFAMTECDVVGSANPPQAGCIYEATNSRDDSLRLLFKLYKTSKGNQPESWLIHEWSILPE